MNILRRHLPVPHRALIKVCLFGIWIMNKHCEEMAAINLSKSPSYSKSWCIGTFQYLNPIFHYITPLEKIPAVFLSTGMSFFFFLNVWAQRRVAILSVYLPLFNSAWNSQLSVDMDIIKYLKSSAGIKNRDVQFFEMTIKSCDTH